MKTTAVDGLKVKFYGKTIVSVEPSIENICFLRQPQKFFHTFSILRDIWIHLAVGSL